MMKYKGLAVSLLSAALMLSGCGSGKTEPSASAGVESTAAASASSEASATATVEKSSEEKAADTVASMSLTDKIEQMMMPSFRTWNGEDFTVMNAEVSSILSQYHFGGVILFGSNMTSDSSTTVALTQALQTSTINGGGLPLLIGTDQEGGNVYRLMSGTDVTSSMALSATGDTASAYQAGSIIGSEMSSLGFNLDFAPDLDVNSNPSNPIIGIRSYSDDAETAASYASQYIKALQDENMIATGKHFPGHGDTSTDSHTGLPLVNKTKEELESTDLVTFKEAVNDGIDMIMSAHIQFPNIESSTYTSIKDGSQVYLPSTLSHTMITDILRNELGFDGVVSTDSLQMDAIKANFSTKDSARLAINAGVDILLMPLDIGSADMSSQIASYVQDIVDMVNDGEISEDTIDASVKRIVLMKYNRGIMDTTYGDALTASLTSKAANTVGCSEYAVTNRTLCDKAVTMLQNDNNVLPYTANGHDNIVILTVNADQKRAMDFAFFRLQREGVISADAEVTVVSEAYGKNYNAAINAIAGADLVIVTSLMDAGSQIDFYSSSRIYNVVMEIETAKGQDIPVIAVSTGIPYDTPQLTEADTVLCVYNDTGILNCNDDWSPIGTYSESLPAAMDAVFGKTSITGKLPVNVYHISNGAFTSEVAWPRGYGMTN